MKTLQDRFEEKYVPEPNSGCWLWIGANSAHKYGTFNLNGKTVRATRLSYFLHNGTIPKGLYVLHYCDNPLCVNPKHLFLGTQKDNMKDMRNKGRSNKVLSKDKIQKIKSKYKFRTYGLKELAIEFEVGRSTIYKVIHDKY